MSTVSEILLAEPITEPEHDEAGKQTSPHHLVRDRVFGHVRKAIMEGRLPPGMRLTERELCEAYDVSRTVIREIARRLEAEKLVDVIPHQGIRVATLTMKTVREIYEIRTELEAIVARNFVNCASDADIAKAMDFGAQLLEVGERQDKIGMAEVMSRFMSFMAEVADNQITADMLAQLGTRINMLRVLAMNEPGQRETGMEGVRAIIAGIEARDVSTVELAVRVYVRRSGESVLRVMQRANSLKDDDSKN